MSWFQIKVSETGTFAGRKILVEATDEEHAKERVREELENDCNFLGMTEMTEEQAMDVKTRSESTNRSLPME